MSDSKLDGVIKTDGFSKMEDNKLQDETRRVKDLVRTVREKLSKQTAELNEKLEAERKLKDEIMQLSLAVNQLQAQLLSVVKFDD
jgi:hypothetical protein